MRLARTLGLLALLASLSSCTEPGPAPTATCTPAAQSACQGARAAMSSLLLGSTSCASDSDCRLVQPSELGVTVSSCVQNPAAPLGCAFAARADADLAALARSVAEVTTAGDQCEACSGTPCATLDCAAPGRQRAACNAATALCQLVPAP
jgi:hypothetical protein